MSSNIKQKAPKGGRTASQGSNNMLSDPRFRGLDSDPRYRRPSKKQTHVKLDERFAHMLRDDSFSRKARVDRYGRKLPKDSGKKELQRFYELEDDEIEVDKDEDVQRELERVEGRKIDPAREGGFSESESSSDESSEEESEDEYSDVEVETATGRDTAQQGGDDVPMGEVSTRIAAVNLDWDNIRATDIMAVASNVCPPSGRIHNVTIYPSEFGLERMRLEDEGRPPPEISKASSKRKKERATADYSDDAEDDPQNDEQIRSALIAQSTDPAANADIDPRALRNYLLSRLKYHYAVLTCDTPNTARAIYDSLDGCEYLTTGNFFDLRFVPEDVTFDDPVADKPRDSCDKVPQGYKPKSFVTEALTHSKPRPTWGEEDQGRKDVQKRAFAGEDVHENDLKAYLGSDSSSDEDGDGKEKELATRTTNATKGEPVANGSAHKATSKPATHSKSEAARQRTRALLGLPTETAPSKKRLSKSETNEKQPVGDMQITFTSGINPTDVERGSQSVFTNKPEDVRTETTVEKYIRKERERKERRRAKAKSARQEQQAHDGERAQAASIPEDETGRDEGSQDEEDNDEADPFNDSFFNDPSGANAAAKKAAKRERSKAAEAESAKEKERRTKERKELELLMADEVGDGQNDKEPGDPDKNGDDKDAPAHFDMSTLRRAEKKKKSNRHKKRSNREAAERDDVDATDKPRAGDRADNFDIDVNDQRFAGKLFGSHEYAIDPTNPRYSGTKGMKKLLEEGRSRRERDVGENGGEEKITGKGKTARRERGDVDDLVERVKRRKVGK
ncbi:MAG: pre-rRNA-processing protein esf1 [Alyxoria varia]|nr:MAG: pre-rRNA-processing protein esf1 [Alyxoria varia]